MTAEEIKAALELAGFSQRRDDGSWHEVVDIDTAVTVIAALLPEVVEVFAVDYSIARGRTFVNGWLTGFRSREAAEQAAAHVLDGKVLHRYVSEWTEVL